MKLKATISPQMKYFMDTTKVFSSGESYSSSSSNSSEREKKYLHVKQKKQITPPSTASWKSLSSTALISQNLTPKIDSPPKKQSSPSPIKPQEMKSISPDPIFEKDIPSVQPQKHQSSYFSTPTKIPMSLDPMKYSPKNSSRIAVQLFHSSPSNSPIKLSNEEEEDLNHSFFINELPMGNLNLNTPTQTKSIENSPTKEGTFSPNEPIFNNNNAISLLVNSEPYTPSSHKSLQIPSLPTSSSPFLSPSKISYSRRTSLTQVPATPSVSTAPCSPVSFKSSSPISSSTSLSPVRNTPPKLVVRSPDPSVSPFASLTPGSPLIILSRKRGKVTTTFVQSGYVFLPREILITIFSFLDNYKDLCAASKVCRSWRYASADNSIWKQLYSVQWGEYWNKDLEEAKPEEKESFGFWKWVFMKNQRLEEGKLFDRQPKKYTRKRQFSSLSTTSFQPDSPGNAHSPAPQFSLEINNNNRPKKKRKTSPPASEPLESEKDKAIRRFLQEKKDLFDKVDQIQIAYI